jgi:N-acetylmuramic acid 6-phosphate etherase
MAKHVDRLPTIELLRVMNNEDRLVPEAVADALPRLSALVDATVDRLRTGGRLHYFGAGTSGRLGVLDAAECPPTFGVPPDVVVAHLAGGLSALLQAVEGAEDSADEGMTDAVDARIAAGDVVVGVAASGETPYVLGAVAASHDQGALTAGIACVRDSSLARAVDFAIELPVGPEVVDGSTRLKAGTAQKLVLNMLSTAVFTRLGHVYQGRMVDVRPTNKKLRRRAIGIVSDLAGVGEHQAANVLDAAGDNPKLAILMASRSVGRTEAEALLAAAQGDLEKALANQG